MWLEEPSSVTKVDQAVLDLNIPEGSDISTVARLLNGVAKTELEKARAAFDWISAHAIYDFDGLNAGTQVTDPAMLIRKCQGQCEGFAKLYAELVRSMGVKCHVVRGYKRLTLVTDLATIKLSKTLQNGQWAAPHAWNIIQIGEKFGLVDCTAGCTKQLKKGLLSDDGAIHEEFFLPEPTLSATLYRPYELDWALVDSKPDLATWAKLPLIYPHAARLGFTFEDLTAPIENKDGRSFQPVRRSASWVVRAQFNFNGGIVKRTTLSQVDGNRFGIYFSPPEGLSVLNYFVYGKESKAQLICSQPFLSNKPLSLFPLVYNEFEKYGCQLIGPLIGELDSSADVTLQVRIPTAVEAGININGKVTPISRRGDLFYGKGKLPSGKVDVMARFTAHDDWHGILQYTVK